LFMINITPLGAACRQARQAGQHGIKGKTLLKQKTTEQSKT